MLAPRRAMTVLVKFDVSPYDTCRGRLFEEFLNSSLCGRKSAHQTLRPSSYNKGP